jgi:hypothetical protein
MKWAILHNWFMPFLWLAIASAISVPVALYFQHGMPIRTGSELGLAYGETWVLRDDFLATIVVYVLNLGTVIWLFNGDGTVRWAAFWATLLGFTKLIMPVMLAVMSDATVGVSAHYVDWHTLRVLIWFQDAQLFVLGLMFWGAFSRFAGAGGPVSAHFAHADA